MSKLFEEFIGERAQVGSNFTLNAGNSIDVVFHRNRGISTEPHIREIQQWKSIDQLHVEIPKVLTRSSFSQYRMPDILAQMSN